jgi:endogenous inhibitor of DNA gyrase (YacG/DUF329 family)
MKWITSFRRTFNMKYNFHKNTHKSCPKCGAEVMWVLNYYYCHTCWLKEEHTQPVIIENKKKPKRKHTKKVRS